MIMVRRGETATPFFVTKNHLTFTVRKAITRNEIMRALRSGKMQISEISERTGLAVLAIRREIPSMRKEGYVEKERINDGRTGARYEWRLV